MIKRCLNPKCGKSFEARSQAKTCSDRCRKAMARALYREHKRQQWFTPASVAEAARAAMGGIDCDPASNEIANQTIRATVFYSKSDGGLSKEWHGRIWCNPPFGRWPRLFVRHFCEEFAAGRATQGVWLLMTGHLQTQWFQPMRELSPIICQPPTRLKYIKGETGELGSPPFNSTILGVGVDHDLFERAFSPLGRVLR